MKTRTDQIVKRHFNTKAISHDRNFLFTGFTAPAKLYGNENKYRPSCQGAFHYNAVSRDIKKGQEKHFSTK